MSELMVDMFRTVGRGDIPDDYVVPFYLNERKRRLSVARVGGRLYAFDDLCTCAHTHARSPVGCSPGRRSCANVTDHGSTSATEP